MKTFTKLIIMTSSLLVFNNVDLSAQCDVGSPQITLTDVSMNTSGDTCYTTLDISYTAALNNGNKQTWFHIWPPALYPDPACDYTSKAPTTCLTNSIAAIGIDNVKVELTPPAPSSEILLDAYMAWPTLDSRIINESDGLTFSYVPIDADNAVYTLSNLKIPIPGSSCPSSIAFTSDLWSTQATSSKPSIHCFNAGMQFLASSPTLTTNFICGKDALVDYNKYSYQLENSGTEDAHGRMKIYLDRNDNGVIDLADSFIYSESDIYIPAGGTVSEPLTSYYTGSVYKSTDLIFILDSIVVNSTQFDNIVIVSDVNICGVILPVEFLYVKGTRSDKHINLDWTVAQKSDLDYFTIETLDKNKNWKKVGQVPAFEGEGKYSYSFSEINENVSSSQYRIVEHDKNGATYYSKVIPIIGYEMGFEVYAAPNPTTQEKGINIQILDKNNGLNKIIITDVLGKVVADFSTNKNTVNVSQLSSGLYFVRVIDASENRHASLKVLVK